MKDRKIIFKIAGVYTSVILGAGFASGIELLSFFVKFGNRGFYGLLLSGLIFCLVGWAVLELSFQYQISDHGSFLHFVSGRFGKIMEFVVILFIGILFATMMAAFGVTCKQTLGLQYSAGVLIFGCLCFVVFLFDLKGIVLINSFLAPVMVVGGILIGLYTFFTNKQAVFNDYSSGRGWVFSALLYSSYNIVTAVSVLVAMSPMIKNKKTAFWGSVLGGSCMTLLGLSLALPLFANYFSIANEELPILVILSDYKKIITNFYVFILIAAVFTTALANGFALFLWLHHKFKTNLLFTKFLVCICGMVVAHIGFSNFVGIFYPLFGYFGFVEIGIILFAWLRLRGKS